METLTKFSFPLLRCLIHIRQVFSSSPTFQFLPYVVSIIKKRGRKKGRIAELARNPAFSCGVKFARWRIVSKATILNQVTPERREWRVHIILMTREDFFNFKIVGSHFVNLKWFPLSSTLGERLIWKVSIITVLPYYLSHNFFSLKLSEVQSALCQSFRFAATFGCGFSF